MNAMKKCILLSVFLLLASAIFSQTDSSGNPLTVIGLGKFLFGMNRKEVAEAVKFHATARTETAIGSRTIAASDLILAGMLFDECTFYFDKDKLNDINFQIHLDETEYPGEYGKLLSILEDDYGESRIVSSSDGDSIRVWRAANNSSLALTKKYDEGKKQSVITLFAYCLNLKNYVSSESDNYLETSTASMGIRVGGGLSTLTGFDRSAIFRGFHNTSVGYRFAWDFGFSIQTMMDNNTFFMTEAVMGVSGATVSFGGISSNVDYITFQSCNYLGKKIRLGRNTNFFVAMGLYIDLHALSDELYEIKTPDFILDNFKDVDFGATLMTGIECGRMQFSINPQIGFIDLTRDKESTVYSRSLKVAVTYKFVMF
jgi:hypothetical protein